MSLDKKAILKEIEVLIRSIKVHYDNIENEHRIPTIELELITSKIRKLHEKSIIYNHLHYMEEEQIQNAKRIKMDHFILNHPTIETHLQEIETASNNIVAAETFIEEKPVVALEPNVAEELLNPLAPANNKVEQKAVEIIKDDTFKAIKLSNKIGINDRFRFIKNLFGGNGAALEDAVKEIENCNSPKALADCMGSLQKNNHWNAEDETVIDFINLIQ